MIKRSTKGLILISPFFVTERGTGRGSKCEIAKSRSQEAFWSGFLTGTCEEPKKRDLHHPKTAK